MINVTIMGLNMKYNCNNCAICKDIYPVNESACNYSNTATHHNGNCMYRTDVCEDCDMDGFGCSENRLFACPPGETGDGYIGNHPEYGCFCFPMCLQAG